MAKPVQKKKSNTSRVPAAIYRIGDASAGNQSKNMLIYGVNGVGKSPFWGSGDHVLIMDADHGLESARRSGSKADAWTVTDFDALEQCYQYVAMSTVSFAIS